MIPIHAIAGKSRKISLDSRHFERLMTSTGQVDLTPGCGDEWKLMPGYPAGGPKVEQIVGEHCDDPGEIWWSDVPKREGLGEEPPEVVGTVDNVKLKVLSGTGEVLEERGLNPEEIMGDAG